MPRKRQPKKSAAEKTAAKFFKRVNLHDGDLILIRADSSLAPKEVIEAMTKLFEETYRNIGVVTIVVGDLDDLTVLSENDMRKWGWFRFPRGFAPAQEKKEEENESDIVDH